MMYSVFLGSRRISVCLLSCVFLVSNLWADNPLKIKFRTRALLDACVSGYGKEDVQGYYRLDDLRVGFQATYKDFTAKVDAGLEGGKCAVKDLLLSYRVNECNTLILGNGYEPFSMDKLISTASRSFLQPAASTLAYTNSRKFGATWHVHHPHYYLATGIYTHNDVNKLGENQKNAFVSTLRGVGRFQPWNQHSLFQVGGAFSFRTREKNTAEPPVGSLSSDGITTLFDIPMLEASVPNMGTEVKGLVELLCLGTRFMAQAEYYWDRMNRTMGHAHRTHGGYVLGGFLLKGNHFEYDSKTAVPGRPLSPRALLLTARLDYADANDSQAGIYGGSVKDVSLGLSYYLNKYVGFKLNASYVWVDEHCNDFYQGDFFLAQMRVQYIF